MIAPWDGQAVTWYGIRLGTGHGIWFDTGNGILFGTKHGIWFGIQYGTGVWKLPDRTAAGIGRIPASGRFLTGVWNEHRK